MLCFHILRGHKRVSKRNQFNKGAQATFHCPILHETLNPVVNPKNADQSPCVHNPRRHEWADVEASARVDRFHVVHFWACAWRKRMIQ